MQYENNTLRLRDVRDEIIKIRNNKMPNWRDVTSYGCAGSFFKNIIIKIAVKR